MKGDGVRQRHLDLTPREGPRQGLSWVGIPSKMPLGDVESKRG
jgi:hypothetical protein